LAVGTDDIHELCNNSGTAKVKIVKNERDSPLFTGGFDA
jgi:hypothetical protein